MKVNKIFVFVNILFCIAITLLNQRQDTLWQLCTGYVFICFLASIFINNEVNFKNQFPFKTSVLYILFFVSIVVNNSSSNWVQYISLAFFPLVVFQTNFYLFKKKYLTINLLILTVLSIAIVASYKVFFVSSTLKDLGGSSMQTNWSNLLGACLPIVFLIKKRRLQYVFLGFVSVFIIIGLKRTGMIALFTTLFIMVFFRVKNYKTIFSLKWAFFTLVLLGISYYYYFKDVSSSNLDKAMGRIERLSEDGGSGRDNLYTTGFSHWIDNYHTPIEYKLIGYGYYGFKRKSGFLNIQSAHNDIIDFAFNYGLLAVVFLIFYYIRLFKILITLWKRKSRHFQFALNTCLVFLIYSMFSAFYNYFFFFIPLILYLSLLEVILIEKKNIN